MSRIKTEELLARIAKGEFKFIEGSIYWLADSSVVTYSLNAVTLFKVQLGGG
jgi:hypothetical protein